MCAHVRVHLILCIYECVKSTVTDVLVPLKAGPLLRPSIDLSLTSDISDADPTATHIMT